jgi:hypothetical protein
VKLLSVSAGLSKTDALKLEYRIKRSPTNKKLSILEQAKDHEEMGTQKTLQQISSELQSVIKSLQQLSASVRKITSVLENISHEQSAPPKTRRAPVRKKVVMKNGVEETIKRVSSTTIVYDLLKKSDQGMNTAALMKATGYDQRKIYNITFRLNKEGKIQRAKRGIYMAH